jgi:hypothetical protein
MIEEAYKLIAAKDAEDGESWSNDSDEIANIMVSFAKAQLKELLGDIRSLNRMTYERDYSDLDYVNVEEIDDLIQTWEAKL